MTLWVGCIHTEQGHFGNHWVYPDGETDRAFLCPGGRPATPEDLYEALGGEKVWWCAVHKSSTNPVLDAERDKGNDLEMWAGCHDSLWAFASGMGDRGQEDKVGRCRMVERILTPALDQEKQ